MVSEEQKLPRTVREDPPCKGCTERFLACSDRCPKDARGEFGYQAWKAEMRAVNEKRKAYANLNRRVTWIK